MSGLQSVRYKLWEGNQGINELRLFETGFTFELNMRVKVVNI